MSQAKDPQNKKDAVGTTGHEWDGITELNTPMPRWWLYTFYVTIVWAFVFVFFYPAIPFVGDKGYSEGVLKASDRSEVAAELAAARAAQSQYLERIAGASLDEIKNDRELLTFASRGGKAAFGDNCAGCHGVGAAGGFGFPNLLDDDWLWGGSLDTIYTTLQHGIRWEEDEETRVSAMPRFLADGLLSREEVLSLVEFVSQISGQQHDAAKAEQGAVIFEAQCSFCHGTSGEGGREVGAPRLNDAVWLYGGDKNSLFETIAYARGGVMPAWSERLDDATIKQLAIYVHGLGGGEVASEE